MDNRKDSCFEMCGEINLNKFTLMIDGNSKIYSEILNKFKEI